MKKIDQSVLLDKKSETTEVFDFSIFDGSKRTVIDQYISRIIKSGQKKARAPFLIFTPNPEQIILAQDNFAFKAALHEADLLIPDGVGVILASKLFSFFKNQKPIEERITGVDLAQEVLRSFPDTSCVIIGGRSEDDRFDAEQTLSYAARNIPWLPGYRDIQKPTDVEEKTVLQFLKKHTPEIVLVAFGAPYQEFWSLRHKGVLQENGVKLVIVVGGTVDLLSGRLHRAPSLFRQLGLEWLFRLFQEPWRWKRQLRLLRFIKLTVRQLFQ